MSKRDPIQDKEGLVEALARYGYTRVIPYSPSWHISLSTPCEQMKPYGITIDFTKEGTPLSIYHASCKLCRSSQVPYTHAKNFLKDMIPIIGRLDAQAYYEDDEVSEYFEKGEPRLRIYL